MKRFRHGLKLFLNPGIDFTEIGFDNAAPRYPSPA